MTVYPFNPTGQAVVNFQPTLDGQQYQAIVTWSLFGQRYFISIYDLSNNLIVMEGVSGSPTPLPLDSLSWEGGLVTAETTNPHNFTLGSIVELAVSGNAPIAFNGTFQCLITGPTSFSYPLSANPGSLTSVGVAGQQVDLVSGYFVTSTLIYLTEADQFQTNP